MEPKRRLRDMTEEEIRGMDEYDMFATFDLDKVLLTENGKPWSWRPFYVRAYEHMRDRWHRFQGRDEADAQR